MMEQWKIENVRVIPLRVAGNSTEYQERCLLDFGPICGSLCQTMAGIKQS